MEIIGVALLLLMAIALVLMAIGTFANLIKAFVGEGHEHEWKKDTRYSFWFKSGGENGEELHLVQRKRGVRECTNCGIIETLEKDKNRYRVPVEELEQVTE